MKRDWDVIRDILSKLENSSTAENSLTLSDWPKDQRMAVSYHVELLMEAGLVNGNLVQEFGRGPADFFLERLTWDGHEFLDAIRSDTVWEKTKKRFSDGGYSMTFDLIKSVATNIATNLLT